MCTVFLVETDDGFDECNTVGELKAALGGKYFVAPRFPGEIDPDHCCLCNVDETATAMRSGMVVEDDGVFVTLRKGPRKYPSAAD